MKSLDSFESIDLPVELNVTVDQTNQEIDTNQQMYFITTPDDNGSEAGGDWVLEKTREDVCNAFD